MDQDRRYVNDSGLPVNEAGRLLTGQRGQDSDAYVDFHTDFVTVLSSPFMAPDEVEQRLERMLGVYPDIVDAGEQENADALLGQLRDLRQQQATPLDPAYDEAVQLRYQAEEARGTPAERVAAIRESQQKMTELMRDTSPETEAAIRGQLATLDQLATFIGDQQ